MGCAVKTCDKPISLERMAKGPNKIVTCSHECALEHRKEINRRARQKYKAYKYATDPDYYKRCLQYARDSRARKKAGIPLPPRADSLTADEKAERQRQYVRNWRARQKAAA